MQLSTAFAFVPCPARQHLLPPDRRDPGQKGPAVHIAVTSGWLSQPLVSSTAAAAAAAASRGLHPSTVFSLFATTLKPSIVCCSARASNLKHYTLAQNGVIGRNIMDAELADACQIPRSQVPTAAGPASKAEQAAAPPAVHAGVAVGQQRPVARVLLGHSLGGACVAEEVIARPQVGTSSAHRQITLPALQGLNQRCWVRMSLCCRPPACVSAGGHPQGRPDHQQSCTSAPAWSTSCHVRQVSHPARCRA